MIKLQKPRSFYESFDRKDSQPEVMHYCPGCGHGIIHKQVARAIDELGIQDRTVMCAPVGCSVFLYYYFDTGNVQCSHGRAPAVATGIRRSLKDAVIISYQGDGDLAAIGTAEIVHAANRGENLTVIFINNAIYGMTGGQMAPTTIEGQHTMTTPNGRSVFDGAPIGMAEVINALRLPIYVERVSLSSPAGILKAGRAIKKAIANQIEGKGFSFVEVLSPCPVNWKMEPAAAMEWIAKSLEPIFPVKVFRDIAAETPRMPDYSAAHPWMGDEELLGLFQASALSRPRKRAETAPEQLVKIGGFGGQGVLSAGSMFARCAVAEGLNATWLPSYGAEMRGGTANASVIVSGSEIGSPMVDHPTVLLALNGPSLDAFEDAVVPGGMIFVNSSIIGRKVKRTDVSAFYAPVSDLAQEAGFIAGTNTAMLTVFFLQSGLIEVDTLRALIPASVKKPNYVELNLKIVDRVERFVKENRS